MALATIEKLDSEQYRVRFYARGLNGKLCRAYDVECRWPYVLVALGLKTSPELMQQAEPLACVNRSL